MFEGFAAAGRFSKRIMSHPTGHLFCAAFRRRVVSATLAAFLALTARAEPFTVDGAVRQALAHNRELASAALGPEAARGRVDQAILKPNPSLDVGAQSDLITARAQSSIF